MQSLIKNLRILIVLNIYHNDGVTKIMDNMDIGRYGGEMDSKII